MGSHVFKQHRVYVLSTARLSEAALAQATVEFFAAAQNSTALGLPIFFPW